MMVKRICLTALASLAFIVFVVAINDPDSPMQISGFKAETKPKKSDESARLNIPLKKQISNGIKDQPDIEGSYVNEQKFLNIAGAYEYFDEEGVSEAAAEEYRQVYVLPYNPLITECEDEWITTETQTGPVYGKKCTDSHKYQAHPYFELDLEVLEALSE